MAVHCPNCGRNDLPDGSQFCYKCGFSLTSTDEAAGPEVAPTGDDDLGTTMAMPPANPPHKNKISQSPPDEELGMTMAMPDARETAEWENPSSDDDDLGMTAAMPPANTPDDEELGMTMAMPDARETAGWKNPSSDDDDLGMTAAMPPVGSPQNPTDAPPANDDEGMTMAMPGASNTEPNRAAASPTETAQDDGLTTAMPSAQSPQPNSPAGGSTRPGTSAADLTLKLGQVLQERYRLEQLLGRGGYGAVYLAEDIKLRRVCVVKQMLVGQRVSPWQLEQQRASFEREASLLVQLNQPGHPNIPEIYDYFYDDTGNYLVMKYIEGHSLKDEIDNHDGRIPWRQAVRYGVDVSSALHYMHTLGKEPIMHRDIKPANILLGNDGRLWLVDFGLAKVDPLEGSGKGMETKAAGSLGYAPLEQWFGEAVPASDIYAVGVTLHHMLTGQNPLQSYSGKFDIQKIHELHGKFARIREVDSKLPQRLEEIIASATAAEVEDRPTALQLQQQLEVLISGAKDAALFTFKSGQSAHTVEELVDLCEKNRKEAETHLDNGDFEHWFLLINRNDLASAAVQAKEQGKNKRDALEKFLKLILPNLVARRLIKFGWAVTRLTAAFIIMLLGAALILAMAGSFIVGQIIEQTISNGVVWNFSTVDLNKEQIYDEPFLNEKFNAVAGSYFDDTIDVELSAPDQASIMTTWNSLPINVAMSIRLAQASKQPRFYITGINGLPLDLITNNISAGINRGVAAAFRRGPVDVSSLIVRDGKITFYIEEARPTANRVPPTLAPPTATPIPPTPTPTPTVTPTPVNVTLVVIFNDLAEDVDMIIEGDTVKGEQWGTTISIASGRAEVIEPPAGEYDYIVNYKDGVEAARGVEVWTLRQAYRVRITPDLVATPTPETDDALGTDFSLNN